MKIFNNFLGHAIVQEQMASHPKKLHITNPELESTPKITGL